MSARELVVLSGKGGTGKTSLVGSFAALASHAVFADCDVDAADLHLLLSPHVVRKELLRAGHEAAVDPERCAGCGTCETLCRFGAIRAIGPAADAKRRVDPVGCEGCGVCVDHCPERAISFPVRTTGEWFVSDTRFGPLVHARLGVGAENSGKLVSVVRQAAREKAAVSGADVILADGPPGVGCPVIASVTGAAAVLAVTEPTVSGQHDLGRLLELCRHFSVPVWVCVNRWDVNPEVGESIERSARSCGARPIGRVPYDRAVIAAQLEARTVVEIGGAAASSIRSIWDRWREEVWHV